MAWTVPGLYAVGAIASGIVLPRLEAYIWPDAVSGISVSSEIGRAHV